MKTYLRTGVQTVEQATLYPSKKAAIAAYIELSRSLFQVGQTTSGSLHYAKSLLSRPTSTDYLLITSIDTGNVTCVFAAY
jgi:hypothetical protein